MKFINRDAQFPGKRKMIKVDVNNVPIANEEPIFVNIVKDEGSIYIEGTPIDAENLNKGNWHDDKSLSFAKRDDNVLPAAKASETQIVTKADGKTWIVPPEGLGEAIVIANPIGTRIKINANAQDDIEFISDPQAQITSLKSVAESAQGTANSKSMVNVNGIKANVNFTSDPQVQINSKASQAHFDTASQNINSHIVKIDNPHAVTKTQIGLGNVDNTSDVNKPVSIAVQTELNKEVSNRITQDNAIRNDVRSAQLTPSSIPWVPMNSNGAMWRNTTGYAVIAMVDCRQATHGTFTVSVDPTSTGTAVIVHSANTGYGNSTVVVPSGWYVRVNKDSAQFSGGIYYSILKTAI